MENPKDHRMVIPLLSCLVDTPPTGRMSQNETYRPGTYRLFGTLPAMAQLARVSQSGSISSWVILILSHLVRLAQYLFFDLSPIVWYGVACIKIIHLKNNLLFRLRAVFPMIDLE